MCLIALQQAGDVPFSRANMRNSFESNDDGAGYMFIANGRLMIRKPFWTFRELRRAYMADHSEYGHESPFVLHYRWSTHGLLNEENTHPHRCKTEEGEVIGVVHNGVIEIPCPNPQISDTVTFVRECMHGMSKSVLLSPHYAKSIGDVLTKANKLVLLGRDKNFSIVNEEAGHWDGPRWYSNYGYVSGKSYYTGFGHSITESWEDSNDEKWKSKQFKRIKYGSTWYKRSVDSGGTPQYEVDYDLLDEKEWKSITGSSPINLIPCEPPFADMSVTPEERDWCEWAEIRGFILLDIPDEKLDFVDSMGPSEGERWLRKSGYIR